MLFICTRYLLGALCRAKSHLTMSFDLETIAAAKKCPISSILQSWVYISRICMYRCTFLMETCEHRYKPKGWHIRIVLGCSGTGWQQKPQNGQISEERVCGWIPGSTLIRWTNRPRVIVYSMRPFDTYKKFHMRIRTEKVNDGRRLQPLGGWEVP